MIAATVIMIDGVVLIALCSQLWGYRLGGVMVARCSPSTRFGSRSPPSSSVSAPWPRGCRSGRHANTRLVNELFDPHVVILVDVRRDHQSTLGTNLSDIVRVFTRTVPEDAYVISGDRNDAINDYLGREFAKAGHDFTVAEPPSDSPFQDVFGSRSAFVVDETLRALGLDPLPPARIEDYTTRLRGEWGWQRLEGGGLVANGAMMNDIESTELLRQFLVDRLQDGVLTPFVYTRRDRAGRTAAFVHYLNWLAENDRIGRVHVAGSHARLLERRVTAEFVHHDESAPPVDVLDACLDEGYLPDGKHRRRVHAGIHRGNRLPHRRVSVAAAERFESSATSVSVDRAFISRPDHCKP
ncbi:hypothetical protein [Haloplanus halobius]|uniref:hypothetical protein n=1 Tax=Haloplanus halobius TaxID=2934938 RepID=UPI00200F3A11|nr:hypothetical protein [Haloplanus sp. XH21]